MSIAELFASGGLALFGLLLAVLAIGLLAGAALGYFTASTDLQQERANAWERGFQDLRVAVERTWIPPTTLLAKIRKPYLKRPLAPEPPHLVIPSPTVVVDGDLSDSELAEAIKRSSGAGVLVVPRNMRGVLFDQDAPTEAARAIELRGDD